MTTEKCHVLTSRNFLKAAQVFFPAWCDTSSGEFSLKNTKLGGGAVAFGTLRGEKKVSKMKCLCLTRFLF